MKARAVRDEKSYDTKDSVYEELEQVFDSFPKYHMKILRGGFKEKLGREDIFKLTVGNGSLHSDSNYNGVRIVNVATSNNLIVKSTMFPHRKIHKCTWTSPDGKTHNQSDHTLINRRWHSSILEVRRLRGADFDTDDYLMVAKVREILAVSKQAAQRFDGERFNLRKLNDLEVRKQYRIEISNRFAALENLSDRENMNRASENYKNNIKIKANGGLGPYKLKQHKPWFEEECLRFLDQRKQAKLQWLQGTKQGNVDNLNNARREASRHREREKKKENLKAEIDELETNSKIENIRDFHKGISPVRKVYKPRTNRVKDKESDWLQIPRVFCLGGGIISISY